MRSGHVALVLELVEGGDLLEYILKHNGLDETASRFITYQLCDALSYIHAQGVAHRDLKPEVRIPSRVFNLIPAGSYVLCVERSPDKRRSSGGQSRRLWVSQVYRQHDHVEGAN